MLFIKRAFNLYVVSPYNVRQNTAPRKLLFIKELDLYLISPYNMRRNTGPRRWRMAIIVNKPVGAPKQWKAAGKADESNGAAKQPVGASSPYGASENTEAEQVAQSSARIRSELERAKNRGKRELKTRRRELRLTPSTDDFIRCAMEVSGLTAGDLAYEGARKILEAHNQHRRMQRNRGRRR